MLNNFVTANNTKSTKNADRLKNQLNGSIHPRRSSNPTPKPDSNASIDKKNKETLAKEILSDVWTNLDEISNNFNKIRHSGFTRGIF